MSKIKLRPLDDRVVVEPLEAEEMTAGGIVLPDAAQEKPQRGKVIATGPGKLLDSGSRGAFRNSATSGSGTEMASASTTARTSTSGRD